MTNDLIFLSNCFGWIPKKLETRFPKVCKAETADNVHTAETAQTHVSLDSYHGVHTPPAVSVRNRWRQQRRGWSPVSATGSLHSAIDISLQASAGAALNEECCRSGKRGQATTCKLATVLAQRERLQLQVTLQRGVICGTLVVQATACVFLITVACRPLQGVCDTSVAIVLCARRDKGFKLGEGAII